MKHSWLGILIACTQILVACNSINTDGLLAHQIIASSEKKWIAWTDETPIDVTQEQTVSRVDCHNPRAES